MDILLPTGILTRLALSFLFYRREEWFTTFFLRDLSILPLSITLFLWGVAGWLIAVRVFDLEKQERGLVGFGLGLVINNWFANLLAQVLPLPHAFWVATLVTLGLGILLAWPLKKDLLQKFSPNWDQWIVLAALSFLFTLIGRGLGLFDDFQNVTSISLMATGDIPPHFPLDPNLQFDYHYFLLLLGTQFMRLASTPPWTALDLARGITLALMLMLGCTWTRRLTKNSMVSFASGFFLAFVANVRWLLLLLPRSYLDRISASLPFFGIAGIESGNSLAELLTLSHKFEGSGPLLFPYAFHGNVDYAFTMAHGNRGVIDILIILLLLLVAGRSQRWLGQVVIGILLASLALANEVPFIFLYIGLVLAAVVWAILRRDLRLVRTKLPEIGAVVGAGLVTLVQGGMLTGVARGWFTGGTGAETVYQIKFGLVSPAIISVEFGSISLLDPFSLVVALVEAGPVILVLPLLVAWGLKAVREDRWIEAGVVGSMLVSLLTVFLRYSGNANETATTRLFTHSLWICKLFAVPLFWLWAAKRREWVKKALLALGFVSVLTGVVMFGLQLAAAPWPVYSYFINSFDVRMYQEYWNRLEPDALIFDPLPYRAPLIFGRFTDAAETWEEYKPEWEALVAAPDPYRLHEAGFDYMYYDQSYYWDHRQYLNDSCAVMLKEGLPPPNFMRRLVDIRGCK